MFPSSVTVPGGNASQAMPMAGQGGGFTTIYPGTESMETGEGMNCFIHIRSVSVIYSKHTLVENFFFRANGGSTQRLVGIYTN